jgi:hypothetical protein
MHSDDFVRLTRNQSLQRRKIRAVPTEPGIPSPTNSTPSSLSVFNSSSLSSPIFRRTSPLFVLTADVPILSRSTLYSVCSPRSEIPCTSTLKDDSCFELCRCVELVCLRWGSAPEIQVLRTCSDSIVTSLSGHRIRISAEARGNELS